MMIYTAIIRTKHAEFLILASSATQRMGNLAEWCRENWAEAQIDFDPPASSIDVVKAYFDPENMGEHEYVTMFEPEEVK